MKVRKISTGMVHTNEISILTCIAKEEIKKNCHWWWEENVNMSKEYPYNLHDLAAMMQKCFHFPRTHSCHEARSCEIED